METIKHDESLYTVKVKGLQLCDQNCTLTRRVRGIPSVEFPPCGCLHEKLE